VKSIKNSFADGAALIKFKQKSSARKLAIAIRNDFLTLPQPVCESDG
jgi:hypothetical protein